MRGKVETETSKLLDELLFERLVDEVKRNVDEEEEERKRMDKERTINDAIETVTQKILNGNVHIHDCCNNGKWVYYFDTSCFDLKLWITEIFMISIIITVQCTYSNNLTMFLLSTEIIFGQLLERVITL